MRRFMFSAVALAVLVIILFNVHGWLVLRRTSGAFERELGDRLQSVVTSLAAALSANPDTAAGRRLLEQTLDDNGLFNLYLVSDSLTYLANLRDSARVGLADPDLELDATAILSAFSGIPTQSRLYAAGSYYLKTAYAPVAGPDGLTYAVLGAEGDARFFSLLAGFRRSLVLINALSLVAIAAVVLVFVSLARRALVMEQAAGRAGTLALLGQMSAAVAHDIKNPLAIIRAAAERLKKKQAGPNPDPAYDYITEEVDRLNAIVTGYLGVGSTRAGERESVDAAGLASQVLNDMAPELKQQRIAVETRLEGVPSVSGNRLELRQAFLNIVLNAAQAQPDGGRIVVTSRVERRSGRNWVVLVFADSGPGMKPAELTRAFEPFHTTKEKGSGLGLFSVKRIVEAHGGRARIDSGPGAGTTVTVRFPA